jgi:hypothetical protein
VLIDWAASALFFIASILALVWLAAASDDLAYSTGWWLGVVATVGAFGIPAFLGKLIKERALSTPKPRDETATEPD